MSFTKTIKAASGHTLFVKGISKDEMPEGLDHVDAYTKFYVVKNFDDAGCVFLFLAKGCKEAPNQIVAWYAGHGSFWSGYGDNLEEAINSAQRDGWLYA